jgi:lipoyl(octanoyl) transferase
MRSTADAILFEVVRPVPFPRAWDWQRQLQGRLLHDPAGAEALLALQHEPCYTLPGQLVLYPVLNLQRHGGDLHLYLRSLEQVVIELLAELGLEGGRLPGLTGVWLEGRKLAAIGVGARRWISQHGLALNVDCALEGFAAITPCGIADRPVGRLADWRPELTAAALQPRLVAAFARHFGLSLRPPTPQDTLQGW